MNRSNRLLLVLILAALVLLVLGALLATLPAIVRTLPGRYAYYLPEPIQAWRRVEHDDVLPTPLVALPTATTTVEPTETPVPDEPTPTPSPTLTPSPTPTPEPALPVAHVLTGIRHEHQGWNNCGPTTLAMALSYWGRSETQRNIAPVLKPDPEDKHVSPYQMVDYTRGLGLEAALRVGGDLETLKRLIAAGFPVVVETWYVRDARDQLGHYRLVVGYDDVAAEFLLYDSLHGPDERMGYQEFDELWRTFNRLYLVVYPLEYTDALAAALGPAFDERWAVERALEMAQWEALDPAGDCVAYANCGDAEAMAWFNVGSSLVALERYEEAAAAYDRARVLGLPFRMLWYQHGPYRAYHAVGRYDEVIALANATLTTAGNLEESYYWRGLARQALGDVAGARSDFQTALHYHPGWAPALDALERLEG